jgi:addiction module HigA family antidote
MDRTDSSELILDVTLHPGEFVNDYLESRGWSQRDLARRSGLTPKTVSEICGGKAPITPPTALAFERIFDRPARFWLSLQRRYDEAQARERNRQLSLGWSAWVKRFPVAEMRRYPWFGLRASGDPTDSLLRFFGVNSPESWESVWNSYAVAYRQTRKFESSVESISAWVRATELAAEQVETRDFDEKCLWALLSDLRGLTRERVEKAVPRAQELLSTVGVAVVWVPELQRTGISGCARWLSDSRALIGLSLRYKTDDQMWFTLFHEIGHLLLHRKSSLFILDNASESLEDKVVDPEMQAKEEEANRFAADTLIPPKLFGEFLERAEFTNDAIHDFSESAEIGPGIVVGRLQHEGFLEFHQGNRLKQKLEWSIAPVN